MISQNYILKKGVDGEKIKEKYPGIVITLTGRALN